MFSVESWVLGESFLSLLVSFLSGCVTFSLADILSLSTTVTSFSTSSTVLAKDSEVDGVTVVTADVVVEDTFEHTVVTGVVIKEGNTGLIELVAFVLFEVLVTVLPMLAL